MWLEPALGRDAHGEPSESALAGAIALVTGGRGFLGSRLSARLQRGGARVMRVGRRPAEALPAGEGAVSFDLIGDVCDPGLWSELPEVPEVIFHCAAQTSVATANEHPSEDLHANVLPMLHLLEVCRARGWRPIVIFAGSLTQVGIPDRPSVDEGLADRPVTLYDRHKLMAEAYLEHYVGRGWARGVTLRLPNLYGPGPATRSHDRGVLNAMMRKALAGEPLPLYGDGHQVRDYLFVEDAAEAMLAAAVHIARVDGAHFVVGSGLPHSLAEAFALVAERAFALTGRRVAVERVTPPAALSPIEERSFVADASRFRERTGWRPATTLLEGIDRTLRSFAAES